MLYLGADHGGFELKEDLKKFLKRSKIVFTDLGPEKLVADDDFTLYTEKVCRAVQKELTVNLGILICRSGHGVTIAANKFKGIRAALCWNELVAKASRNDDHANVLCLPADYISSEHAEEIVGAWLKTSFSEEPRYLRRLKHILDFEK